MNKIKDIKITKKQILKGKNGNQSYDFYKLKIIYSDNTRKTITVFTEPNAIDINNHEQTKSFMINSLFGPNGLIKEQGRDDYIFLGRPTKDANGKTIPYRFYKMENSNKNAQEYFDEYVYPKLQNIFNSNKQTQTTSLYDEIKSPFDDINTIKKIVELYANLEIKRDSDLYHDITHYDFNSSNDMTKHMNEFWYNIGYPCNNKLYNNIKRSKNDDYYNDIINRTILNKFENYNELNNYVLNNKCLELNNEYTNFMNYNKAAEFFSQESFIDFKEKYSIKIPIENIKFKVFAGLTYNRLNYRFKDIEGGGSMGFHVCPQRLKTQDAPKQYLNPEMKFYINAGYDTYKFAKYFKEKCEQNKLNYYFKVVDPYRNKEHERSDKLCIYTEFENAEKYLQIIKDIIKEHPEIKYRKPPITAGTIQGIIGVGSDAISNGNSYNYIMSKICFNIINKYFKGKDKKDIMNYINKNPNLLYEIREKIIRKARELGLSEKICLSKDAVLQLKSNKSKRR